METLHIFLICSALPATAPASVGTQLGHLKYVTAYIRHAYDKMAKSFNTFNIMITVCYPS